VFKEIMYSIGFFVNKNLEIGKPCFRDWSVPFDAEICNCLWN